MNVLLPDNAPEGARLLAEQVDIAAVAEKYQDFDGSDLGGLASVIKNVILSLLPTYTEMTQTLSEALKQGSGHCLHRAAVVHAIAMQIPHVRTGIISRAHHSANILASNTGPQAVVIDNGRYTAIGAPPIGTMFSDPVDLVANPDTTREDYVLAQILLGLPPQELADFRCKVPVRPNGSYEYHVMSAEEVAQAPRVPLYTKLYVGAPTLRFLHNATQPTGVPLNG